MQAEGATVLVPLGEALSFLASLVPYPLEAAFFPGGSWGLGSLWPPHWPLTGALCVERSCWRPPCLFVVPGTLVARTIGLVGMVFHRDKSEAQASCPHRWGQEGALSVSPLVGDRVPGGRCTCSARVCTECLSAFSGRWFSSGKPQTPWFSSGLLGAPAGSALPGEGVTMQVTGPCIRPTEPESLGVEPQYFQEFSQKTPIQRESCPI
nr:uncharacterized protein LOC112428988 [Macaca nemestrina]